MDFLLAFATADEQQQEALLESEVAKFVGFCDISRGQSEESGGIITSNINNQALIDNEPARKPRRKRNLPELSSQEVVPEMKQQRRQNASQRVVDRLELEDKTSSATLIKRHKDGRERKEAQQCDEQDIAHFLGGSLLTAVNHKRTDEEEEAFRRRSAERKREERNKHTTSDTEREAMRAKEAARKRQERARKLLKDPNLREKLAQQKRAYRERKAEEKRAWAVLMALATQGKA